MTVIVDGTDDVTDWFMTSSKSRDPLEFGTLYLYRSSSGELVVSFSSGVYYGKTVQRIGLQRSVNVYSTFSVIYTRQTMFLERLDTGLDIAERIPFNSDESI